MSGWVLMVPPLQSLLLLEPREISIYYLSIQENIPAAHRIPAFPDPGVGSCGIFFPLFYLNFCREEEQGTSPSPSSLSCMRETLLQFSLKMIIFYIADFQT